METYIRYVSVKVKENVSIDMGYLCAIPQKTIFILLSISFLALKLILAFLKFLGIYLTIDQLEKACQTDKRLQINQSIENLYDLYCHALDIFFRMVYDIDTWIVRISLFSSMILGKSYLKMIL